MDESPIAKSFQGAGASMPGGWFAPAQGGDSQSEGQSDSEGTRGRWGTDQTPTKSPARDGSTSTAVVGSSSGRFVSLSNKLEKEFSVKSGSLSMPVHTPKEKGATIGI